jgi:hypothetical protein
MPHPRRTHAIPSIAEGVSFGCKRLLKGRTQLHVAETELRAESLLELLASDLLRGQ